MQVSVGSNALFFREASARIAIEDATFFAVLATLSLASCCAVSMARPAAAMIERSPIRGRKAEEIATDLSTSFERRFRT